MIYFKRKTGSPIIQLSSGIELPNIVIVPSHIFVDVTDKHLSFSWGFYYNSTAYLNNFEPLVDGKKGIRVFNFIFAEDTNPNFQTALNIFDWSSGGDIQQEQLALNFFGGQPDPTSEDENDTIGDNWDGMIYNP